MRPINKRNFGNILGRIAVRMTKANGTIVDGYIVKQIGSHRYSVSDGVETRNLYLAQTTAKALTLGDESMTILITKSDNSVEHIRTLFSRIVHTTQGSTLSWSGIPAVTPRQGMISPTVVVF
jgi:hypothetical protein